RDFVVVVLLSLLQLQASLRIRTAAVSNANLTVLCCCVFRLTVGINFLLPSRPVPSGSAVPWAALRQPLPSLFFFVCFFFDPFVGVANKRKRKQKHPLHPVPPAGILHVVVVVNR
ncbi:MAG: hypothetical protein ACK55Z_18175, partial [bacterium]